MTFLTDDEKLRISAAIAAVEQKSRGELVTVIAGSSDEYRYIPILWAALLALLVPALLASLGNPLPEYAAYLVQLCTFLGSAALFALTPLKMHLIPGPVKKQRAGRHAREQFFRQNLHRTREHTGVLLFVSVAERYVEIIADSGINDVVYSSAWQGMVNDFILHVKQRRIADGFITTIAACGTLLEQHFPASDENIDELPNHLVEL